MALERPLHVQPEARGVPVQRSVDAYGLVGKTADLDQIEHAGVKPGRHRTSTLSAEIKSQETGTHATKRTSILSQGARAHGFRSVAPVLPYATHDGPWAAVQQALDVAEDPQRRASRFNGISLCETDWRACLRLAGHASTLYLGRP